MYLKWGMREEKGEKKVSHFKKILQRDHIHCCGVHFISYTSEDWKMWLGVFNSAVFAVNHQQLKKTLASVVWGEEEKWGGVGRGVEMKSVWILLSVTESIAGNLLSEKCGLMTFCVSRHPNLAWYFMLPAPPTCTPEASFLLLRKRLRGKCWKREGEKENTTGTNWIWSPKNLRDY